jgi:hypothetical protein
MRAVIGPLTRLAAGAITRLVATGRKYRAARSAFGSLPRPNWPRPVRRENVHASDQRCAADVTAFRDPADKRVEAFHGAQIPNEQFRPTRLIEACRGISTRPSPWSEGEQNAQREAMHGPPDVDDQREDQAAVVDGVDRSDCIAADAHGAGGKPSRRPRSGLKAGPPGGHSL